MTSFSADTLRILVSTDNHVGYEEHHPVRGNDGWGTFEEIMEIAEKREVDIVLLAGDLFHDHRPSQKALDHVVESLRKHCFGDKPCSVQIIGDESEHFRGQFNHANYNDPNLNVAIPVFSIHGNHDEPTGQESRSTLDTLHAGGHLNYFGRQHEADNIVVKPLLMQKGSTKLALYGLSNVRDERLFQTFRTNNVKFLQPNVQKAGWYNLLAVHQNHVPHTDTSYLPESFLPAFMDMVIWGHEHDCKINPIHNESKGFDVIQPGSSIATSLSAGEAIPKHVCILDITGKECKVEPILLKTVRPFMYKEIALANIKEMVAVANKQSNQQQISVYCKKVVEGMIKEANEKWLTANQDRPLEDGEELIPPLPLIRLRVDYSAPPSGDFHPEPQIRLSKTFSGKVANEADCIVFHHRRKGARTTKVKADQPDAQVIEQLQQDEAKLGEIVLEHLGVQELKLLPRNLFSDALSSYLNSDKRAIDHFLDQQFTSSADQLMSNGDVDEDDEDEVEKAMDELRAQQEERFARGEIRPRRRSPNAEDEADGVGDDNIDFRPDIADSMSAPSTTNGAAKGKGRAAPKKAPAKKAPAKQAPAKKPAARGKKKQLFEDDEDEDSDPMLIDDGDDDDIEELEPEPNGLFMSQASAPTRAVPARTAAARGKTIAKKATPNGTQTQLNFGRPTTSTARGTGRATAASTGPVRPPVEQDDDEISDDDAFEAPPPSARFTRRR